MRSWISSMTILQTARLCRPRNISSMVLQWAFCWWKRYTNCPTLSKKVKCRTNNLISWAKRQVFLFWVSVAFILSTIKEDFWMKMNLKEIENPVYLWLSEPWSNGWAFALCSCPYSWSGGKETVLYAVGQAEWREVRQMVSSFLLQSAFADAGILPAQGSHYG